MSVDGDQLAEFLDKMFITRPHLFCHGVLLHRGKISGKARVFILTNPPNCAILYCLFFKIQNNDKSKKSRSKSAGFSREKAEKTPVLNTCDSDIFLILVMGVQETAPILASRVGEAGMGQKTRGVQ